MFGEKAFSATVLDQNCSCRSTSFRNRDDTILVPEWLPALAHVVKEKPVQEFLGRSISLSGMCEVFEEEGGK